MAFAENAASIDRTMAESIALIVAAGRGERALKGQRAEGERKDYPKQYWLLAGKPVLRRAVEAFLDHPSIADVKVVIRDEDREIYESAVAGLAVMPAVIGGATRQQSVRNGLEALASSAPRCVLIHDGARPLVSSGMIERVARALDSADAAAPMLGISDTLRRKTAEHYEILPRDDLFRAQTPQGFRFAAILDAHREFAHESFTDDIALAERAGLSFAAVAGEEMNLKLTTPEDFALAERLAFSALPDMRTGTGYDVHRFTAGDHVFLCGVKLPHEFALEGHSDADAGLHALTDAILGALASGDIGAHFPPTDERWRGAASHIFLAHAASLVRERGGIVAHVDVTLICERPRIAPYRDAMRARVAEILGIDLSRVAIKATTTEGLGFTGRREGIAAQAVATIRLPL
jgi:2-C-methyl-D-erythritol 4-phosphate cytidylyltransferase / 2-C-methyl-D-erythritol 2,4-cyclodiphosphate synthase